MRTFLLLALLWGCGPRVPFAPSGRDAGPPPVCASVPVARTVCVAEVAYQCDGTQPDAVSTTACDADGRTCVEGLGCLACAPASIQCDGETVLRCRGDGSGFDRGETCDGTTGLRCSRGGCRDLCAEAAATASYLGCEYTPVTLANRELEETFPFAIAIANPQLVAAVVSIDGGGLTAPRTLSVAPGDLTVVELPWVSALRGLGDAPTSVLVRGGAYAVRSDVPVTVTQFNPLSYRRDSSCSDRSCFSFTNDASLLLPTHVLTGSYLAVARASQLVTLDGRVSSDSGFVTIVGVDESVEVEVRTTAPTVAGPDVPSIPRRTPTTFTLARGDVLQLLSERPVTCTGASHSETRPDGVVLTYCDLGPDFDLTGTEIRSTGRVAVFSGHDCSFVPYDRWACDHLEEQLFPVEALGSDLFLPVTEPLRPGEPNLVRFVSAIDGNVVRFDPPLDPSLAEEPPILLDRGEFFEVELRAARWLRGSGPLLGAVFLVGQDYRGLGTAGSFAVGDPAMALVIPNAQFRTEYTFLSPASFSSSAADVVAPMSARIDVDGTFVVLTAVDGTAMGSAHVELMPGVHRASGSLPFGVYVSGFGSYTSYFVPGGMDFVPITAPF